MSLTKHLIAFLIVGVMANVGSASTLGCKIEKAINGGWQHSYICDYTIGGDYQVYLDTRAVFLAPRSDPMRANHEYLGLTIGGKVNVFGLTLDAGTGTNYWWSGNDFSMPEGYADWNNYLSITKEF